MQFKPSIIAIFAAMLTVAIAAPKPASDEIIKKREAAPQDVTEGFKYYQKKYAGEKRSDASADYIYSVKAYPEEEKRSAAPAQEAEKAK